MRKWGRAMIVFVLIVLSAGFAFMASLATAVFLRALPWKRLAISYLVAGFLMGLVFILPELSELSWFDILDGWIFIAKWIFIGCWIGTAPVALGLIVIDLWRGKPAADANED